MKKTAIALALASMFATARADEALPPVTVTCSAACQAPDAVDGHASGGDLTPSGGGGSAGGAGGGSTDAPPPPPPPPPPVPPPQTKAQCVANCDMQRKEDDNNCQINAAVLNHNLIDQAILAQRAKLGSAIAKMLGADIGIDSLADSVLANIQLQVDTFKTTCGAYAALSQNICYQPCKNLAYLGLLALPLVRKRDEDEEEATA
jgi:hypothetical protein